MSSLIVHEWIARDGGSERVLDAMVEAFGEADVMCLWKDDPDRYAGRAVRESWLARVPLRRSKALAMPFMSHTWARVDTSSYDWVLVSSHLFAHHIAGPPGSRRPRTFVYVHTPARYLWTPELDPRGAGPLARMAAVPLRRRDRAMAGSDSVMAANSDFVRRRIQDCWDREDVTVLHPPVAVGPIAAIADWSEVLDEADAAILRRLPDTFLLGASRFVSYKRLDLVIAAGEASGVPVVIAGRGPEQEALERQAAAAGVPVDFVDRPSDALLYALYQRCLAFVFPPIEDFGIMPVEAMAAGAPVIVNAVGGATESVVDGVTGVHVAGWERDELAAAVTRAASLDPADSRSRARMFDTPRFQAGLRDWMAAA